MIEILLALGLLVLTTLAIWSAIYYLAPVTFRVARAIGGLAISRSRRASRAAELAREHPLFQIALVVLIGGALSVAAGDEFLDLAEAVRAESPTLLSTDREIHDLTRQLRYPVLTRLFMLLTIIGTPVGLFVIVSAVSIYLLMRDRRRWGIYLVLTSAGGGTLNTILKLIYERKRPDLTIALRSASGHSFPSGHAMMSIVVFGALAYLVTRADMSWRRKSAAIAAAVTFIVGISTSRIYLGVHWISDIGAGLAAGAVWLLTSTTAYELVRRFRLQRRRANLRSES